MFVYNNFDATIPTMDLGEEDKNFIALINRELKSYIDNNERMRWVCYCKRRASHLAVQYDFFYELLGSSFVFELEQKDIQLLFKRILMNVRQRWQSKGKARERYTLFKVGSFFAL